MVYLSLNRPDPPQHHHTVVRFSPRCPPHLRLRYTEVKNVVRERAALRTQSEAEEWGKAFNFKVGPAEGQDAERLLAPKL